MKTKILIWIIGILVCVSFANAVVNDVCLNLTFNNNNTAWQDSSPQNHVFQTNGVVTWLNNQSCKYYGCGNFTGNGYINTTSKCNFPLGMSVTFWRYVTISPSTTQSSYYDIGNGTNRKTMQDALYGANTKWNAATGQIDNVEGTPLGANAWHKYWFMYNGSRFWLYEDGVIISNTSNPYGTLNYSLADLLNIGTGLQGYTTHGYLDSFVVYNRSNFTSADILSDYNLEASGTPSDKEVHIKKYGINYTLPYNWTDTNRSLIMGTLQFNITIENSGILSEGTGSFTYNFTIDNKQICNSGINISASGSSMVICNWTTSYGFHNATIYLDTLNQLNDAIPSNNNYSFVVPFMNRPWSINITQWYTFLKPYCANSSNKIAYDSCQAFGTGGGAENWQESWGAADIDARGKKGRQNAMICFYSDYTNSALCNDSFNYVQGWSNRTDWAIASTQAIHGLIQAGYTYDLMFRNMTKAQHDLFSNNYESICQIEANRVGIRPDQDASDSIAGDNGKGFGTGIGAICDFILGEAPNNPTLIQDTPQQNYGKSIPKSWQNRFAGYLRSMKNDSYSNYQEGWDYKWYSQTNLLDLTWLYYSTGMSSIPNEFQSAYCGMAREALTEITDMNYLGSNRNDFDIWMRGIQRGDSHSYSSISSGTEYKYGVLTYLATFCNDESTKLALIKLRNDTYTKGSGPAEQITYSMPEFYAFAPLMKTRTIQQNNYNFTKVLYDNANDILKIRTNYTYINDTIIQIDGGEEAGNGHSQAQGYYLYAFGQPFLDYEQTPYNDDVRSEFFKNGFSLKSDNLNTEGAVGFYSQTCGNAPLNQYYGMSDCSLTGSYPDFRQFPLQYGGDLEDYMGTTDGKLAGVYRWQPYENANPVEYWFVKFGDLVAIRGKVSANTEGKGVQYHLINIQNESREVVAGNNVTFTNGSINLETDLLWSNKSMDWVGGNTSVNICYGKTDCTGGNRGTSTYRNRYLNTSSSDVDLILAHHWYYSGNRNGLSFINGTDKGILQGNNYIFYDTDNNGKINYSVTPAGGSPTQFNCSGGCWALAFNMVTNEYAAFNSTGIYNGSNWLWTANESMEVDMQGSSGQILMTINNMQRRIGIDYPRLTTLTVNTTFLTNASGLTAKSVTFNVTGAQTPVTYTITANSSDYRVTDMNGIILGQGTQQEQETGSTTSVSTSLLIGTGSKIIFGNGGSLIIRR